MTDKRKTNHQVLYAVASCNGHYRTNVRVYQNRCGFGRLQRNRFTAASSECPVTNWISLVGTTDGAGWYRNFEHLPWEDPSEHIRRSPLMYVGNVTTPTLLITGELDLRTPMAQTEEYYQALKFLKVPTAMIRLQDEWHAYLGKPSNFMRALAYRRSWFEKYRTDKPTVF